MGEGKVDLCCVVTVSRVLTKIEVAEKDEVVEFLGSEPSKVSGSLVFAHLDDEDGGSRLRSSSVISMIASAKLAEDCTLPHLLRRKLPESSGLKSRNVLV